VLPKTAQEAIALATARIDRAEAAGDVEGVIGASKDLVETVAKIVLDVAGQSYGSDTPVQKLASMSMKALGIAEERPALQRLGGSMATAAGAIGELRNTDGTGHGRSAPSTINVRHAEFVRAAASAWCKWMLALAEAKLAETMRFNTALVEIGGERVFRRGALKAYLEELQLDTAPPEVQRKLGLAVARRWTMNSTFMPRLDVIDPLAEGAEEFPLVFQAGLIEGLLLDKDGRVRMDADDVRKAIEIAMRMRPRARQLTLTQLADHVDEAAAAPSFDHDAQASVAALFGELALENRARDPAHALSRIAARLETLAAGSNSV
jgi:Abortive infection C-terminus